MIRHTALFKFSSVDKEALSRAFEEAFNEFFNNGFTEHESFEFGADLGIREGNFDFGVTVVFKDEDGYIKYNLSEAHQELLRATVLPNISDRASLQFRI